jgi:hypothetical protein
MLPTMNATTTAVFAATGLDASSIFALFVGLINTAVSFGLWLIQVAWPFLLVIGFILLMWGIARYYSKIGKH